MIQNCAKPLHRQGLRVSLKYSAVLCLQASKACVGHPPDQLLPSDNVMERGAQPVAIRSYTP